MAVRKRGAPTLIELMKGRPTSVPPAPMAPSPRAPGAHQPGLFAQSGAINPSTPPMANPASSSGGAAAPRVSAGTTGDTGGAAIPAVETKPLTAGAGITTAPPSPAPPPIARPGTRAPRAGAPSNGWNPGGGWRGWLAWLASLPRSTLYVISGSIVLVVVVWLIAYSSGQRQGQRQYVDQVASIPGGEGLRPPSPLPAPSPGPGSVPEQPGRSARPSTPPRGGEGAVTPPPPSPTPPTPAPAPAPAPGPAALKPGMNYLVAEVLFRPSDAERCREFLTSRGLAVQLIEARLFNSRAVRQDPGWTAVVIAEPAIAGESFTARRAERDALVSRLQTLGREWRAADRTAPTTFASPLWARYEPPR
jgi:hypothetical protein